MLSRQDIFFALHAVQTGCITLDSLLQAIRAQPDLSTRPLCEVLVHDNWMDSESAHMLRQLVERHISDKSSDRLLSESSDLKIILKALENLDIPELSASIATMFPLDENVVQVEAETEQHYPEGPGNRPLNLKKASRFRVIRLHAKGGLGEVFVARDEELGREVALKEIQDKYAFHPESRNRFMLEAEVTSSLEHPGIVPVYGMGQHSDGRPYYAMRFVRGNSLKEAIDQFHKNRPLVYASLEFRKLLRRFIDVCQAIGYAHSRGVLHRDLKPGNIMLGEHGETLVVDWGLARCAKTHAITDVSGIGASQSSDSSSTPTVMGTVIGTPAFMPPEQARGEIDKLGPASDVYSLGATLYQLLTGVPPFAGLSRNLLLPAVIGGQLSPPRSVVRAVPQALEAICLKAMALSPNDRYQKPQELAEEIDKYLADEAVHAYREPWRSRVSRWIRKHPTYVATAAVTIVLGLVGSGLIAYMNGSYARSLERINENLTVARNEAEREKLQAEGVTDFLVQSIRKIDPEQDGKDVKVFDVLESAKFKLDEDRDMGPIQKADILQALGLSYHELGSFSEACKLFTSCLKLRTEHLGEDHHETLTTLGCLGLSLLSDGQYDSAMDRLAQTEKRMQVHVGPQHNDTLNAMLNLAKGYSTMGDYDRAIAKYDETLKLMTTALGEGHPSTIAAMGGLAFNYETIGDFEKGIPLLEKAYEKTKSTLGINHTETLTCMNNLALAYTEMGELKLAIPIYEDVLARVRTKFGEEHWETYSSMSALADAYSVSGDHERAIPLAVEAVKRSKDHLGPEHPSTLICIGILATTYFAAEQYDKAEPLFVETLHARRKKLGDSHPSTMTSLNNLGRLYQVQGHFEKAKTIFEELTPLVTSNLGADHTLTLSSMNNLAVALRETQDYQKSIDLFERALQSMKDKLGIDHISTFTCAHNLAATYERVDRIKEATEMEHFAYTGLRDKLGDDHATVRRVGHMYASMLLDDDRIEEGVAVLENSISSQRKLEIKNDTELAELLDASAVKLLKAKQFDQAQKYSEESVTIHALANPDTWTTFRSMCTLAECLMRRKNYSEAESKLLSVWERLERHQASDSKEYKDTMNNCLKLIIELYTTGDRPEEAAKWQQKLDSLPE